jgi:hypothetical protein
VDVRITAITLNEPSFEHLSGSNERCHVARRRLEPDEHCLAIAGGPRKNGDSVDAEIFHKHPRANTELLNQVGDSIVTVVRHANETPSFQHEVH